MPMVELMAIHNKPTAMVFNILIRYSLTPGSTMMIIVYKYKRKALLFTEEHN
jgi:hypothetical protein